MLCNNCNNKSICKYYDIFKDAPMVIELKSCEKFSGHSVQTVMPERPRIRKPIEYDSLDVKEEFDETDEEKIFVDITNENTNKVVSITDILLGGENNEER